jgi:hypothetical protein
MDVDHPDFQIRDEVTGMPLTAEQAERWLFAAVTNLDQAQEFWDALDGIDRTLTILALVVCPGLRDALWPLLTEDVQYWYTVLTASDAPQVVGDSGPLHGDELVRAVVHDVVSDSYREAAA